MICGIEKQRYCLEKRFVFRKDFYCGVAWSTRSGISSGKSGETWYFMEKWEPDPRPPALDTPDSVNRVQADQRAHERLRMQFTAHIIGNL